MLKSFQICAWFSSRMEQMSGKFAPSATLTFFSLACKSAAPESIHVRKPLTTEQGTAAAGFVSHVWIDSIRLEVLLQGREWENSLARVAKSSRS